MIRSISHPQGVGRGERHTKLHGPVPRDQLQTSSVWSHLEGSWKRWRLWSGAAFLALLGHHLCFLLWETPRQRGQELWPWNTQMWLEARLYAVIFWLSDTGQINKLSEPWVPSLRTVDTCTYLIRLLWDFNKMTNAETHGVSWCQNSTSML